VASSSAGSTPPCSDLPDEIRENNSKTKILRAIVLVPRTADRPPGASSTPGLPSASLTATESPSLDRPTFERVLEITARSQAAGWVQLHPDACACSNRGHPMPM
jgi:hypothetical protein